MHVNAASLNHSIIRSTEGSINRVNSSEIPVNTLKECWSIYSLPLVNRIIIEISALGPTCTQIYILFSVTTRPDLLTESLLAPSLLAQWATVHQQRTPKKKSFPSSVLSQTPSPKSSWHLFHLHLKRSPLKHHFNRYLLLDDARLGISVIRKTAVKPTKLATKILFDIYTSARGTAEATIGKHPSVGVCRMH